MPWREEPFDALRSLRAFDSLLACHERAPFHALLA